MRVRTLACLSFFNFIFALAGFASIALDPDGAWVNSWGYLQKAGVLVAFIVVWEGLCGSISLMFYDDREDELEHVTHNPRLPKV